MKFLAILFILFLFFGCTSKKAQETNEVNNISMEIDELEIAQKVGEKITGLASKFEVLTENI